MRGEGIQSLLVHKYYENSESRTRDMEERAFSERHFSNDGVNARRGLVAPTSCKLWEKSSETAVCLINRGPPDPL